MLTSQMIKEAALAAGADLCGIGCMSRFDNAPCLFNPQLMYPDAKSIIGLAFRIPRGVQRGIEEGTQFFQYPSIAYGGTNQIYAPAVLYEIGRIIEDHGYEAFVYRNTGARHIISDMDGELGQTISPEEKAFTMEKASNGITGSRRTMPHTRSPREDSVPPDLFLHFRLAAVACGLGEIGWSKMMLTPEFGPMQRFVFIFTDAELEPDPLYNGDPLCKKCMLCARECPGGCIPTDSEKKITVYIGDKKCEWGDIDVWRCNTYYTAAGKNYNPFVPTSFFEDSGDSLSILDKTVEANEENAINAAKALDAFTPSWSGYGMAKCGGCLRACISRLEKKGGCLENTYKEPLRTKKPWRLDR